MKILDISSAAIWNHNPKHKQMDDREKSVKKNNHEQTINESKFRQPFDRVCRFLERLLVTANTVKFIDAITRKGAYFSPRLFLLFSISSSVHEKSPTVREKKDKKSEMSA